MLALELLSNVLPKSNQALSIISYSLYNLFVNESNEVRKEAVTIYFSLFD